MSDYSDNPRKRERHRRHKGRSGGGSGQAAKASRAQSPAGKQAPRESAQDQGSRQEPKKQKRPESRFSAVRDLPRPPALPTPVCPRCGEIIRDIPSALSDRATGSPMHFDCVLDFLKGAERLSEGETLSYIGQGRFAVMRFENPADPKTFKIVRTIEWEGRESRAEWRVEIASGYSQVP